MVSLEAEMELPYVVRRIHRRRGWEKGQWLIKDNISTQIHEKEESKTYTPSSCENTLETHI